jgi:hypothetical protein
MFTPLCGGYSYGNNKIGLTASYITIILLYINEDDPVNQYNYQCEVDERPGIDLIHVQTWDKYALDDDMPDSTGYEILCSKHAGIRIKQLEAAGDPYVLKDLDGHYINCELMVQYGELIHGEY